MSAFGLSPSHTVALLIVWLSLLTVYCSIALAVALTPFPTRSRRHIKGDDWDATVNELLEMFRGEESAPQTIPTGVAATAEIPLEPITPRPYVPMIRIARSPTGNCGLCDNGEHLTPGVQCPWCTRIKS